MLTCVAACTLRLQMKGLSVDSLLDGIAVLRATTVDQQCASIEILDQYLVEDASNLAGQVNLLAAIAFAPISPQSSSCIALSQHVRHFPHPSQI